MRTVHDQKHTEGLPSNTRSSVEALSYRAAYFLQHYSVSGIATRRELGTKSDGSYHANILSKEYQDGITAETINPTIPMVYCHRKDRGCGVSHLTSNICQWMVSPHHH